jgi:toxin ParE1/3/4
MRIVIREAAALDIEAIFEWISRDRPKAAAELVGRIRTRINRLARSGLAHIGRPGLIKGTRELIEGPYIIVYTVDEAADQVTIVAVVHGAQDRQS